MSSMSSLFFLLSVETVPPKKPFVEKKIRITQHRFLAIPQYCTSCQP